MPAPSTITLALAEPELDAFIEARLLQALRTELPQANNTGFVLAGQDAGGQVVAGLVGSTSYGWLLVKCLWVSDVHQRCGIGRRLMQMAQDHASELGCHGAWLDTFHPQAHAFYVRWGYEVFGELANQAQQATPHHRRWFMRKTWA